MKPPTLHTFPGLHALRVRERVVWHVDSLRARYTSALALLCGACLLFAVLAREGRLGWCLSVLAAALLITRGIFLGRPVTAMHAAAAVALLVAGLAAHLVSLEALGEVMIAGSGVALMWPTAARPEPDDLPRVWALIDVTKNDPLAPFAMQTGKCYHFDVTGTAALAYRTRFGFAAVSGDPIGDEARFQDLDGMRGWGLAHM